MLVPEGINEANEGGGRIRGGATKTARMHRVLQRIHLHGDLRTAAQRGGEGRFAHRRIARVRDENNISGKQFRPGLDELRKLRPALLLRPLDEHLNSQVGAAQLVDGTQRGQVHDNVALAVGGAPRIPAAIPLGEGEWIRIPL